MLHFNNLLISVHTAIHMYIRMCLVLGSIYLIFNTKSCFHLARFIYFFKFLQGMNLNKRELNEHVEFESQTYYAAFAAELEACAQPMWGLLSHCKVRVC